MTDYIQQAMDLGFYAAAYFDPKKLSFENADIFRLVCEKNECGMYKRFWTCPPAVGTVPECVARIRAYDHAIVVQYVLDSISHGLNEDLFNAVRDTFNYMSRELWQVIKADHPDAKAFGMSGCALCESCTYIKNEPCRFPDQRIECNSGHCLDMQYVCTLADLAHAQNGQLEFFCVIFY